MVLEAGEHAGRGRFGMSGERLKFSPAEFAARTQGRSLERQTAEEEIGNEIDVFSSEEELEKLADDIRSYLSAPRGLTEEERRGYSETLNRAVLGFPQEREQVLAIIEERLIRLRVHHAEGWRHPYATLAEALFAEVVGLNILELVLANREGLEEIQVVGTRIYEVRGGFASLSPYSFAELKDVERIQQNLVLFNNDRITPRKRWAEVMLRDGSRVTMTGFGFTSSPTLTIRFYTMRTFSLSALAEWPFRTLDARMAALLRAILAARFNIVVIGATNSGKTNLIKALIAELPNEERIITIEGRFEMMLGRDFPHKNIVEYESSEEDGAHSSEQAFKLALRQSPQRIVHAEIRDEDANIYVRACTRGHSGSMTTVHANKLEDVPEAITDMCMLDGRAMNAERLAKRITEYVTEVGIEMKVTGGRRVIARIGELSWNGDEAEVRDWATYNESSDVWRFDHAPSEKKAGRLAAAGYAP
ncbi:ATPase, T2SS/T4P/T4SS family [Paenibacillus sp. LHD-117]|uniref:ATPase, T2SS/T4P/T4SS family n=1 Tax=Paenibacillus sp. LHD-117 TaxID=3071412 RepID=UPI0027E00CBF|nr:ATPase, T2SS/T4P/T4SS family [Paenibacillus sp. LHD-117]MDQ6422832.1 ATPase, T2SS/T4P/T4SS family [Paenibacillus sp. LHD-117]